MDVIVRAEDAVLLIEPVGRDEWELPGGHPEFDEEPANAAVRELEEETGIAADSSSLDLLSAVHSTHRDRHYTMITYVVDYSETDGTPAPGEEATDVEFWSVARILSSPEATRRIDREAIETMLDE
ncbi:NUDIX hydrolase [Halobaculum rubrum]|uniref:NUDIX hydrolase n=1 Tax=Halobaculum rubrum TaxID=2872158 RepID=UPI001CA3AC68|nr:NUDIX hydrolase [Halobaculum rubrum]QZX98332.1 NUDIX hydrolase [Halobaculum rubrum]